MKRFQNIKGKFEQDRENARMGASGSGSDGEGGGGPAYSDEEA